MSPYIAKKMSPWETAIFSLFIYIQVSSFKISSLIEFNESLFPRAPGVVHGWDSSGYANDYHADMFH
jgi:hypothetical protein